MGNTILLADKSITIQKIVQLTFADDNYQIQTVSDGQAALDSLSRIQPDLILADISLPLKSGYDVCTAVRTDPAFSAFAKTPVILLAGIYETMDEERARQVEERVKQVRANDFLSKPFDPQLLISKVKQYLSASPAAEPSPVFAEESDASIPLFDNEIEEQAKPPEDNERTMMLPAGTFGNMFAEPLPLEEEVSPVPAVPVDIDSVIPVGEPVFDEASFPEVELGAEEEEAGTESMSRVDLPASMSEMEPFSGREEREFEFNSGSVKVPSVSAGEPESLGSIPLILPEADEPFGDVFEDNAETVQWTATPASEEDSPFGIPEPPLLPEPEPSPAIEAARPALEGLPEGPELPSFEESVPVEEPQAVAALEPQAAASPEEGFDETWPGVSMTPNVTPPVEDLFESEALPVSPVVAEDAEELEADLSEAVEEEAVEESDIVPVPAQVIPVTPAPAAAVSDDLIDRIAERVLNKLSERVVSEIVWMVVPDLAEKMIRRELEKLHAGEDK